MRKKRKYLIVILTFLMFVVACNKVSPSFNRENLKGTWVAYAYDGETVPLEEYVIYTYVDNSTMTIAGVVDEGDGNYKWISFEDKPYFVYCKELEMNADGIYGMRGYPGQQGYLFYHKLEFAEHIDDYVKLSSIDYKLDGRVHDPYFNIIEMQKQPVTSMKLDSLIGKWQFSEGKYEGIMLEFDSERFLNIYTLEQEGWKNMTEEPQYYNKYDQLLMLTVYDNEEFGVAQKWSVACFDDLQVSPYRGEMSMKQDGETLELRKVIEVAP